MAHAYMDRVFTQFKSVVAVAQCRNTYVVFSLTFCRLVVSVAMIMFTDLERIIVIWF